MVSKTKSQKVTPRAVRGVIKLPAKGEVKVDVNAVSSSGERTSPSTLIETLKKAAKRGIFPAVRAR